jgi:outer membrane protein assembly factor BamB/tetratricopeptide (TPR) repeat protein
MTRSIRRAGLLFLVVAVVGSAALLQEAHGQVKLKPGREKKVAEIPPVDAPVPEDGQPLDGFGLSGVSLPKDEKGYKNKIQAAIDYTQERKWEIAIKALQDLVDIKEDVFVQRPHKTPGGKERMHYVSVKTEANRLIGALPKEGLEIYRLTYREPSLALLQEARAKGDPALLGQLIKRFAHTDAGQEAIVLLAAYDLDRGNYVAASLRFEKLLAMEGADKLPPAVLFRMAYAFTAAGDKANAKRAWDKLKEQGREVVLGKESRTVGELQEYVNQVARSSYANDAREARLFRGTPNRANQLVGGPAFLEARWKQPMTYADIKDNPVGQVLDRAKKNLKRVHQPLLPAYFPVTATVARGEQRRPLLLFKNYWGIQAVDMKTGKLAWNSPSNWSLERMLAKNADGHKAQALNQWLNFFVDQNQRPAILFENSTVGTLSTDNEFVYVVEDLAVPPAPNMMNVFNPGMPQPGNATYTQDLNEAIHHSRLEAFDVASGKLAWEVGAYGEKDNPLSDCYFLGPPLPLAGKLYVLVEKQQELRLVCLETIREKTTEGREVARAKVVFSQALATAHDKMELDVTRRSHAAHLAYGEGILVVPTNAGAVFGIDLLENRLVWAYPYREATDAPPDMQPQMGIRGRGGLPPGWVWGPDGRPMNPNLQQSQWKISAPVIQDGKVVFTAPDARSLHCINLRDGSPVWKKPRSEDDLYFGGVYNGKVVVVGKKRARGLNLTTGEILWDLDTGIPSGQGIASNNVYYLPLLGRSNEEPEICAIDVDRGMIIGHARSRAREVPGNLIFFEGDVVSQTADDIVVYPQLKVKIAQMDELLAKNPKDPAGLFERGELRLDQGDLPGAIDDLRGALRHNPPDELRTRVRGKLYDALTDYVQRNFNDAEEYLKEYEELCKVEVQPGAGEDERSKAEKEERKRRTNFLYLVAKGREAQGKLVEAFEKYQQYSETAGTGELQPLLDEPTVKANPDVWARGRIAAMVAKATPANRKPLEDLIAARWNKLQESTTDLNELRRFVRLFGPLSAVGREARFHLAERLLEEGEPAALLEAEKELNALRAPREAPETAARAVEALARLYTRRGLLEDAAYCYRLLGRDYARVKVRDGKTGSDFYDDAATDKRLMPHLDEPRLGWGGRLKAEEVRPGRSMSNQVYHFERIGEPLPFFGRYTLGLHFGNHQLQLVDSRNDPDAPVWTETLTRTMFQNIVQGHGQPNAARFPFRNQGHLVVLPVGHLVFGIDPVNRKVLWEHSLAGALPPGQAGPMWNQITVDPKDGSILVLYQDSWAQRLGQAGPLEGAIVCLQTRDGLEALDPLTGKTLWKRGDIGTHSIVFADDEHVFVVEFDQGNLPNGSRVLRAADGVSVKGVPPFADLYQKRLGLAGRRMLLSGTEVGGAVVLRLYDVLAGKDLWSKKFAPRSIVLHSEDPRLAGVVEPNGKVVVFDLHTQKEVLATAAGYDFTNEKTGMDPSHLTNLQGITLLSDGKQLYLACNGQPDVNMAPFGGLQPNVHPGLGMRSVPINGRLYAYDLQTGVFKWQYLVPNQMIVLDHFREMPVVLFTSRYTKVQNLGGLGRVAQVASVMSLDKRTGKWLYENKDLPNAQPFHALKVDARAGRIEFSCSTLTLVHHLNADEGSGKSDRGGAGAKPVPGAGGARATPLPGQRLTPATEVLFDKLTR